LNRADAESNLGDRSTLLAVVSAIRGDVSSLRAGNDRLADDRSLLVAVVSAIGDDVSSLQANADSNLGDRSLLLAVVSRIRADASSLQDDGQLSRPRARPPSVATLSRSS